jgi:hypothetical protein
MSAKIADLIERRSRAAQDAAEIQDEITRNLKRSRELAAQVREVLQQVRATIEQIQRA